MPGLRASAGSVDFRFDLVLCTLRQAATVNFLEVKSTWLLVTMIPGKFSSKAILEVDNVLMLPAESHLSSQNCLYEVFRPRK